MVTWNRVTWFSSLATARGTCPAKNASRSSLELQCRLPFERSCRPAARGGRNQEPCSPCWSGIYPLQPAQASRLKHRCDGTQSCKSESCWKGGDQSLGQGLCPGARAAPKAFSPRRPAAQRGRDSHCQAGRRALSQPVRRGTPHPGWDHGRGRAACSSPGARVCWRQRCELGKCATVTFHRQPACQWDPGDADRRIHHEAKLAEVWRAWPPGRFRTVGQKPNCLRPGCFRAGVSSGCPWSSGTDGRSTPSTPNAARASSMAPGHRLQGAGHSMCVCTHGPWHFQPGYSPWRGFHQFSCRLTVCFFPKGQSVWSFACPPIVGAEVDASSSTQNGFRAKRRVLAGKWQRGQVRVAASALGLGSLRGPGFGSARHWLLRSRVAMTTINRDVQHSQPIFGEHEHLVVVNNRKPGAARPSGESQEAPSLEQRPFG